MRRLLLDMRWLFAAFVGTGAALIFLLAPLAGRADSRAHWILIAAVVGLMVVFGVVVSWRSSAGHSDDRDAEMFYYLGFIYTLLTLVATFTPLLAQGAKPSTQHVLGLFGLGLITTFVGLAGRIFFLHARAEVSVDAGAERLGRAYSEAARHLEATALQISRVGVELEQLVRRSHDSLAASLEKATEKIGDDVQRLLEKTNSQVSSITTQTATQISNTLNSAADGLSSALNALRDALAALKLPPSRYGVELQQRLEELIKATASAIDTTKQFGDTLTTANTELSRFTPVLGSAASGMHAISSAAQSASRELEQNATAVQSLSSELAAAQKSLADAAQSSARLTTALSEASNELVDVQRSSSTLKRAVSEVAAAADAATTPIAKLGSQASDSRQQLVQLVAAMTNIEELAAKIVRSQQDVARELFRGVELLKEHQGNVEQLSRSLEMDLKASEDALRKVHGNLVAATKFIVNQIQ